MWNEHWSIAYIYNELTSPYMVGVTALQCLCLFVSPSVCLCRCSLWLNNTSWWSYSTSKVSEQVNKKCPPRDRTVQRSTATPTEPSNSLPPKFPMHFEEECLRYVAYISSRDTRADCVILVFLNIILAPKISNLDRSLEVGSLCLPITASISLWSRSCIETWFVRSTIAQRMNFAVVSVPAITKSRNVNMSCSRS